MDDYWLAVIWALLPTVVILGTFAFILRGILRADRTERRAYARIEAEERRKRGLPPVSDPSASSRSGSEAAPSAAGAAAASVDGSAAASGGTAV